MFDRAVDVLRQSEAAIVRIQNERLRRMLDLCARGHSYYQRRWAEAGIDIASIRGVADLARLPFTPKRDLMSDPESFRLQVPELPLHERILWDVGYTTGSTGDPTPVYNTTHDYHAYLFQSRRVAEISGMRSSDVIANLFPLTAAPMGAFVRSAANAYAMGATIFVDSDCIVLGSLDRMADALAHCDMAMVGELLTVENEQTHHGFSTRALMGAILYLPFRVINRAQFLDANVPWATGLFEVKEHATAIGLAVLPAYWAVWREPSAGSARKALTTFLAVATWWNLLVGHVDGVVGLLSAY